MSGKKVDEGSISYPGLRFAVPLDIWMAIFSSFKDYPPPQIYDLTWVETFTSYTLLPFVFILLFPSPLYFTLDFHLLHSLLNSSSPFPAYIVRLVCKTWYEAAHNTFDFAFKGIHLSLSSQAPLNLRLLHLLHPSPSPSSQFALHNLHSPLFTIWQVLRMVDGKNRRRRLRLFGRTRE